MNVNLRWIIALTVLACLPLASCAKVQDAADEEAEAASPAKVERLNGEEEPARITLTEDAAKRIDVQTAAVAEADVNGTKQKTMPYAALIYDTEGETWAFTNAQPLTYERQKIKVDRIEGDKAILAEGPAAGTLVVIVGAAELYGSEEEFGEE